MKYLAEHDDGEKAAFELIAHCRKREGAHYDTYKEYKSKRSNDVADFVKILYRPPEIQGDRRCYWVSCPEKCGKKLGTRIGFHNAFAKVLNHMQGDPQSHPTLDNEQANGP